MNRTILVLMSTFLVGFLVVVAISLVFQQLIDELDERLENERARLFVGEQVVNTLRQIESTFYQMAPAKGDSARRRLQREISLAADQLEHFLYVKQHGGEVRQTLALNLFGVDEMVRSVHYKPRTDSNALVIDVIELAPFVDQIRSRAQVTAELLAKSDACDDTHDSCLAQAQEAVRSQYKLLPSFFYRLNENANRQFFESQAELGALEAQLHAQQANLRRTQWAMVLGVIVFVMGMGLFFVRKFEIAYRELQRAKDDAEAANVAKSRFLATMSHEIRTPMNGIMGIAQILDSRELSPSGIKDCTRILMSSGKTLLTLLNDILDLSKIEAGKLDVNPVNVRPNDLLLECVQLYAEGARAKGLVMRNSTELAADATYRADAERLRQMLSNLINNAIKFTTQGEICVSVREVQHGERQAELEFAVSDTGIGVEPDKQRLLFKPFSQIDSSSTRSHGGTGLGLAIVRNLAELMGGQAGVQSQVGEGSRFWFRIKVELASDAEKNELSASQGGDGLEDKRTPILEGLHLSGRILLVEDTPLNIRVVELALGKIGPLMEFVTDGRQAVDTIAAGERYDLVLMDLRMPVMDGLQATQAIRTMEAQRGWRHTPIVAFTANAFEEDRQKCLQVGMDDFLAKPLHVSEFVRVLQRWLPLSGDPKQDLEQGTNGRAPLDSQAVLALIDKVLPLLDQNMFDAISQLHSLQLLTRDTEFRPQVDAILAYMDSLNFSKAAEAVRSFAQQIEHAANGASF